MALELSQYLSDDTNLQGYWRLESDGTDTSSNGYTLTGTVRGYVSAKFNNGADFEVSSSDYLNIAGASCANLNITGSQTWSCWVKPESNVDCRIMWKNNGAGAIRGLYTTGGSGTSAVLFYVSGLTTNEYVSSSAVLSNDAWHHIAGVYDSANTKLKVWVDGVKVEVTASGSSTTNAGTFSLGGEAGQYFDGVIDDAAVFNRALTDAEVLYLYNTTAGGSFLLNMI